MRKLFFGYRVGFTPIEIKQLLSMSAVELMSLLQAQHQVLQTKTNELAQATQLTRQAMQMLQQEDRVDWSLITNLIKALKMQILKSQQWAEQYS